MAKPNYKFEKRQKDLARQKKQEEKQQRKAALKAEAEAGTKPEEGEDQAAAGTTEEDA